jgi:2-oxoglutarate dehydrogenase E2 component (dihydrolipoamide succinyltransferase)
MAVDIKIPEMGESVRTGVIARWIKNEGDFVKVDEPVLELETDKITAEITAPVAGTLTRISKAGETVPIGAVVGRVAEGAAPAASAAPAAPAPAASKPAPAPVAAPAPSAPSANNGADVRSTPLAKKLAEEHKIDLSTVHGTGPGGRVREQDVLDMVHAKSALAAKPAPAPVVNAAPAAASAPKAGARREKVSALRARIAQRLVEAQHTAAMLTTFNEVDMSAVMSLRSTYKEEFEKRNGVGLGFMSFFVKAAASALSKFPIVNAQLVTGADGSLEVEFNDGAHIALAVSTPKGLTVPVLRNCQDLTFAGVELGVKELATKARDGKLALHDLQGGTFTITNGGIFGSMMSTPILNAPQSAILGMHAIKSRAVENPDKPGEIVLRPMMYLALSYDHRLLDGSEAVQFLVHIKNAIEKPERMMLGI